MTNVQTDNTQALYHALERIDELEARCEMLRQVGNQVINYNANPQQWSDAIEDSPGAWLLCKQADAVESIKPTAEMKAEMLGSFKITEEITCSACYFDEPDNDCEVCAGDVAYAQDFQIPWTSQKQIIGTAVAHAAQALRNQAKELEEQQ